MIPSDDFLEWLGLMISIPFAFAMFCFFCMTTLYVYLDASQRSRNRLFGLLTAVAVAFAYWPIGFFAYVCCIVTIDRNRRTTKVHGHA